MARDKRYEKLVRFDELTTKDFDEMSHELYKREKQSYDANEIINIACEALQLKLKEKKEQ